MGCDIHTFVEIRKKQRLSQDSEKLIWVDGNLYIKDSEGLFDILQICASRDYRLFSLLANVRNDQNKRYIADPKGIPEDACIELQNAYANWEIDAHSASYFTLKELIDWYNKEKSDNFKNLVFETEVDYELITPLIQELEKFKKYHYLYQATVDDINDDIRFVFWFDD